MSDVFPVVGCGQHDKLRTDLNSSSELRNWAPGAVANSRWLVVSNHPEIVANNLVAPSPPVFPANLYKTTLLLPETGSLDFRVFLWHGHGYSTNKFFLIVLKISGSSDSGSASNHRSISMVRKKGLLYQVGLCCAKAQRNGTLDPASGATLPVGMDVVLVAYEVGPPVVAGDEQFVGAVDEFTVTAEPGASLEIRTVISASPTIAGSYANPILETANGVAGHVRGSWPYSAISLSAQDSVDLAAGSSVRYEVGAADGAEEKMFTPRPRDSGARTNRGLYGVNVHYEMPFVNTSDPLQQYSIQGYFRARGIFAKYYGAVVEVLNAGIPPIGDGSPGETAVVQWPTQTAGREIPVFLLDNATGGACGTPVDHTFAWEPI